MQRSELSSDLRPQDGWQRPYGTGIAMLVMVLAFVCAVIGLAMTAASLMGTGFGAWPSSTGLTPGLIGAGLLGAAPGLFMTASASTWDEVRCLVLPVLAVVPGWLVVSVFNLDALHISGNSGILLFLFSAAWLGFLGIVSILAIGALILQLAARPSLEPVETSQALPAWTKPLVALLGSAWFGAGAGLIVIPDFWGALVPWDASRIDVQSLGVLTLAIGAGVLAAIAEDDLRRLRTALAAALGVAVCSSALFLAHHDAVSWWSGPGLSVAGLVGGLLLAGVIGSLLARDKGD